MRRLAAAFAVVVLVGANTAAQQTALTDAQIKSADVEVPQLVELLELKPGMTVGDVGAGFGAWTMRFARELGTNGPRVRHGYRRSTTRSAARRHPARAIEQRHGD